MTAHKISEIFGSRLTKKLKGKRHASLHPLEHGHHAFRAYWKHGFVKGRSAPVRRPSGRRNPVSASSTFCNLNGRTVQCGLPNLATGASLSAPDL